ncbi:hypothetical protein [Enterococcus gilvus]|uniref:hypothetical protein n=1 Tax=Enterococcus gilvus TaxID=160453 RepID=UPI0028D79080|nr:hypothetical protein [Enterococcus gilvus]
MQEELERIKNEKAKRDLLAAFGGCFGAMLIMIVNLALSGYVAMFLWNGIIVTTFKLQALTYWQAFGLDVMVSFLTFAKGVKTDGYSNAERFAISIFCNVFFLLFGILAMTFI